MLPHRIQAHDGPILPPLLLSPFLLAALGPEAIGVFRAGLVFDPSLDKRLALIDFLQCSSSGKAYKVTVTSVEAGID